MSSMDDNRGYIDAEYTAWLKSAAKEVAVTLKKLDFAHIKEIIAYYEEYREYPASMYALLEDNEEEMVKSLIDTDRIQYILLVKTKPIFFFPSILSPFTSSLDYGVAMYRRYPLHSLWFSVIALNESYLKSATESMLRYLLEHELTQGEIVELARHRVKTLSPAMKGIIHEEARIKAIQRSGITLKEIKKEQALILELSAQLPMVPAHLASSSLFLFLERNWERVKQLGLPSTNEREKNPNEKLGIDLSLQAFGFFLKELKQELSMTGAEYGFEIM